MQERFQAIRNRVQECIARAEQLYGIKMPKIEVRFDLRGRAAGIAGYVGDHYYVRFNLDHIALGGKTWEHLLSDTVPHELGHSVCQAFPEFGYRHNKGWQRVCIALGGTGKRLYSEADAPEAMAKLRPFQYVSTSGSVVSVSPTIHARIQGGVSYNVRGGGKVNAQCAFSYNAPTVVAQPTKVPNKAPTASFVAPAPMKGGSNADAIRARITEAKRNNEGMDVVILYGVNALGMKRALASSYVKNNWDKA